MENSIASYISFKCHETWHKIYRCVGQNVPQILVQSQMSYALVIEQNLTPVPPNVEVRWQNPLTIMPQGE